MAAGATYEPIATQTLASEVTNITFNSIPSTYTDLRLVLIGIKPSTTSTYAEVQYNGDTGANYSYTLIYGNGTSAASFRSTGDISAPLIARTEISTSNPQMGTLDILSYTGGTYKTSLVTESSDLNGSGSVTRYVTLWRSTAAINSIKILDPLGRKYGVGTTATLYGIKAA